MAPDAIVFAMANPDPEVHPDDAARAGARGRRHRAASDFPNQINNVLAFPGVFSGAMDVRARCVTEGMKQAAAVALADVIADELAEDRIIPSCFDPRVAPAVAAAVAEAARRGRRRPPRLGSRHARRHLHVPVRRRPAVRPDRRGAPRPRGP